jgi:hypothetical protein
MMRKASFASSILEPGRDRAPRVDLGAATLLGRGVLDHPAHLLRERVALLLEERRGRRHLPRREAVAGVFACVVGRVDDVEDDLGVGLRQFVGEGGEGPERGLGLGLPVSHPQGDGE